MSFPEAKFSPVEHLIHPWKFTKAVIYLTSAIFHYQKNAVFHVEPNRMLPTALIPLKEGNIKPFRPWTRFTVSSKYQEFLKLQYGPSINPILMTSTHIWPLCVFPL